MAHGKPKLNLDLLKDAGPGQCVSMKEAASYYCMRVQEEKDGCAKTSNDCGRKPAARCRSNQAPVPLPLSYFHTFPAAVPRPPF